MIESAEWERNRTEPSAKANLAPLEWKDQK
jgi:hypothetical protein